MKVEGKEKHSLPIEESTNKLHIGKCSIMDFLDEGRQF